MRKLIKQYIEEKIAAAAVEFSLVVPMLILLLVGTVDIGFYMTERMQMQNTAHSVAEYISLMQDDTNLLAVAEESYGDSVTDLNITSEFLCECADGVALQCPVSCGADDYQRRYVEVTVSGSFSTLFPYPGISKTLDLQGFANMRVD